MTRFDLIKSGKVSADKLADVLSDLIGLYIRKKVEIEPIYEFSNFDIADLESVILRFLNRE